jgi:xanthosine utilization system XapX-like protein
MGVWLVPYVLVILAVFTVPAALAEGNTPALVFVALVGIVGLIVGGKE